MATNEDPKAKVDTETVSAGTLQQMNSKQSVGTLSPVNHKDLYQG